MGVRSPQDSRTDSPQRSRGEGGRGSGNWGERDAARSRPRGGSADSYRSAQGRPPRDSAGSSRGRDGVGSGRSITVTRVGGTAVIRDASRAVRAWIFRRILISSSFRAAFALSSAA